MQSLGRVHYLWGGGEAGKWEGGKRSLLPYLGGGGSERFYSRSGGEAGGGKFEV